MTKKEICPMCNGKGTIEDNQTESIESPAGRVRVPIKGGMPMYRPESIPIIKAAAAVPDEVLPYLDSFTRIFYTVCKQIAKELEEEEKAQGRNKQK